MDLRGLFKKHILAVDFGTANCVIMNADGEVLLKEPTVVAIDPKLRRVLAVGEEARSMLGKVPEGLESRRPLKNGGISNYRLAEALLKKFINIVLGNIRIVRPDIIVSVPAGINSVEERAIIKAFNAIGASKIYLFPEPIAASLGSNMPIHTPSGNLIINLGGGTAEIAVLSLNGLVAYESHKGSGDMINESISSYIKKKYNVFIGEITAEQIKIEIGTAILPFEEKYIEVKGKNLKTNLPVNLKITSSELVEPIRVVLDKIVFAIKNVLAKTHPELISDIMNKGGVLSGGTSLLQEIDTFFSRSIGIPISITDEPLTCVARGLVSVINNVSDYTRVIKK